MGLFLQCMRPECIRFANFPEACETPGSTFHAHRRLPQKHYTSSMIIAKGGNSSGQEKTQAARPSSHVSSPFCHAFTVAADVVSPISIPGRMAAHGIKGTEARPRSTIDAEKKMEVRVQQILGHTPRNLEWVRGRHSVAQALKIAVAQKSIGSPDSDRKLTDDRRKNSPFPLRVEIRTLVS